MTCFPGIARKSFFGSVGIQAKPLIDPHLRIICRIGPEKRPVGHANGDDYGSR